MDLSPATASLYARHAFTELLKVADRLGDERVNERPLGADTNSVASLILHCCGVAEFWLGHVGVGRTSQRERDSEFTKTATLAELRVAVEVALAQVDADLAQIEVGVPSEFAPGRQFLLEADESDGALVVHVLEELFQHLGHAELAADALLQ